MMQHNLQQQLAVPVWQGRISPVFDTAGRLLLVQTGPDGQLAEREETLAESSPSRRSTRLEELGVEVLLCGAISRPLHALLTAAGITVVPFLAGEVREILQAYYENKLPDPAFAMPGCRCGGWGRQGRGRQMRRRAGGRGRGCNT